MKLRPTEGPHIYASQSSTKPGLPSSLDCYALFSGTYGRVFVNIFNRRYLAEHKLATKNNYAAVVYSVRGNVVNTIPNLKPKSPPTGFTTAIIQIQASLYHRFIDE